MSFKDNLLKKIQIDGLSRKVINSLPPQGSIPKVDKASMKILLEMASYTYRRERDLDLYCKKDAAAGSRVFVLDNELAIYHTEAEDVVLRKSPYVKEMISIRNAIKILNDSDVLASRKQESVKTVQKECIEMLDLTFGPEDLAEIEKEGIFAWEKGDSGNVLQILDIFSELIGFIHAPAFLAGAGYSIYCSFAALGEKGKFWGPFVSYNPKTNQIILIDESIGKSDKDKINNYQLVLQGREEAQTEGAPVFSFLREEAEKASYSPYSKINP